MKQGEQITLKDGSHWIIEKIFDTHLVKDKLYRAMRKNDGRFDYYLSNPITGSKIIMNDKELISNHK